VACFLPIVIAWLFINGFWEMGNLFLVFYGFYLWAWRRATNRKWCESLIEKRKHEALACDEMETKLRRLDTLAAWCLLMERPDLAEQLSVLALELGSQEHSGR